LRGPKKTESEQEYKLLGMGSRLRPALKVGGCFFPETRMKAFPWKLGSKDGGIGMLNLLGKWMYELQRPLMKKEMKKKLKRWRIFRDIFIVTTVSLLLVERMFCCLDILFYFILFYFILFILN